MLFSGMDGDGRGGQSRAGGPSASCRSRVVRSPAPKEAQAGHSILPAFAQVVAGLQLVGARVRSAARQHEAALSSFFVDGQRTSWTKVVEHVQ